MYRVINHFQIFLSAGGLLEPAEATIVLGLVMFVSSFVTPFVVDRMGRKFLLLVSASGTGISQVNALTKYKICHIKETNKIILEIMKVA